MVDQSKGVGLNVSYLALRIQPMCGVPAFSPIIVFLRAS